MGQTDVVFTNNNNDIVRSEIELVVSDGGITTAYEYVRAVCSLKNLLLHQ